MTKNKSNNKRLLGLRASPVVLIRTSSVLFVLLMFGHTSAYPWNSIHQLNVSVVFSIFNAALYLRKTPFCVQKTRTTSPRRMPGRDSLPWLDLTPSGRVWSNSHQNNSWHP
jgi:hypothetical protein